MMAGLEDLVHEEFLVLSILIDSVILPFLCTCGPVLALALGDSSVGSNYWPNAKLSIPHLLLPYIVAWTCLCTHQEHYFGDVAFVFHVSRRRFFSATKDIPLAISAKVEPLLINVNLVKLAMELWVAQVHGGFIDLLNAKPKS
jgi:hypothetical protein